MLDQVVHTPAQAQRRRFRAGDEQAVIDGGLPGQAVGIEGNTKRVEMR